MYIDTSLVILTRTVKTDRNEFSSSASQRSKQITPRMEYIQIEESMKNHVIPTQKTTKNEKKVKKKNYKTQRSNDRRLLSENPNLKPWIIWQRAPDLQISGLRGKVEWAVQEVVGWLWKRLKTEEVEAMIGLLS